MFDPPKDVLLDSVLTHPQITRGHGPTEDEFCGSAAVFTPARAAWVEKRVTKLIQKTPQKTYGFFSTGFTP